MSVPPNVSRNVEDPGLADMLLPRQNLTELGSTPLRNTTISFSVPLPPTMTGLSRQHLCRSFVASFPYFKSKDLQHFAA